MMQMMLAVIDPQLRTKPLVLVLLLYSAASLGSEIDTAAKVSLAVHFPMPGPQQALVGQTRTRVLQYEDTFAKLARREGVGFGALQRANPGVDAWLPEAGAKLLVPSATLLPAAPREGVVVNLSELKMFLYQPEVGTVSVYPIGIGDEGSQTPLMETVVTSKIENPTWYPPASIRARHAQEGRELAPLVPPGPDNPLGPFAVQLARKGYFIHGTNLPMGVGRRVSSGCIRLYNLHITDFVRRVALGQTVRVIEQPYKVAWHDDSLYLEAHPERHSDKTVSLGPNKENTEAKDDGVNHSGFVSQIIRATSERQAKIDWSLAFATARAGRGVPVKISL